MAAADAGSATRSTGPVVISAPPQSSSERSRAISQPQCCCRPPETMRLIQKRVEQEASFLPRRCDRIAGGVEAILRGRGRRRPGQKRTGSRYRGWCRSSRLGKRGARRQREIALAPARSETERRQQYRGEGEMGRTAMKRQAKSLLKGAGPYQIRPGRREFVENPCSPVYALLFSSLLSQRLACVRTFFGAVPPRLIRLFTELSTESTP